MFCEELFNISDRNCVLEQINDVTDDAASRDLFLASWNKDFYPYAFPLLESLHRRRSSPSNLIPLEGGEEESDDDT